MGLLLLGRPEIPRYGSGMKGNRLCSIDDDSRALLPLGGLLVESGAGLESIVHTIRCAKSSSRAEEQRFNLELLVRWPDTEVVCRH
jgi:hypothetical protein